MIKCSYCKQEFDECDCPDLFYPDANTDVEQLKLLEELQDKGYNIVTCGNCGNVFITKRELNNGK